VPREYGIPVRGELIDERYRLERQLGHGAMAEVWLATDTELDRPVALKLLAPDADRARFEREARAGAALSHPNVTRIYDFGQIAGRPYMALEYLPGGTLEDRLPEGTPLQDDQTEAIAVHLAGGLAHAHQHGLVHRDLKPSNVLFDEADRPKISDFGLARVGGSSTLTEAGTVLGTAAYISPEQAAGEPATPASDVYSFGVILFRMLTGRLPFEAESPLELVDMHRRLDAPPVEILRPDAPRELAALAASALERNPRRRPPDGAALAAALGVAPAAVDDPTVVMRRSGRPGRRSFALVGATLVLLAAFGTAGALLLTGGDENAPAVTTPPTSRSAPTTTEPAPPPTTQSTSTTTPTAPTTTTTPTTTTPTTTTLPTTTIETILPTIVTTTTISIP
jgi:eukaryotic-like serine/threonine-protein kinase